MGRKLSSISANVGATVRAIVVGILARIYHVGNPEAGPADTETQQSGEDMSFGRRFVVQAGDNVLLAGGAGD